MSDYPAVSIPNDANPVDLEIELPCIPEDALASVRAAMEKFKGINCGRINIFLNMKTGRMSVSICKALRGEKWIPVNVYVKE